MTSKTFLDCGLKHAAMTGAISIVTPACQQASKMEEELLTLYWHN